MKFWRQQSSWRRRLKKSIEEEHWRRTLTKSIHAETDILFPFLYVSRLGYDCFLVTLRCILFAALIKEEGNFFWKTDSISVSFSPPLQVKSSQVQTYKDTSITFSSSLLQATPDTQGYVYPFLSCTDFPIIFLILFLHSCTFPFILPILFLHSCTFPFRETLPAFSYFPLLFIPQIHSPNALKAENVYK